MPEILSQRCFVELREKLRPHRGIEAADFVDQLTFVHEVFTFRLASECTGLRPAA